MNTSVDSHLSCGAKKHKRRKCNEKKIYVYGTDCSYGIKHGSNYRVFAEDTASDEGFNLNLCIASEPQTIDPALNSAVDGAIMCNHMFEGLVKWVNDGEGNAVTAPGQAESWEKTVNDDGTVTYTVKLRDGIKWSDGQAVTAGDFDYAWQRLANPETAADYCYMIDMVKGYDSSC